jgi:hypothetical protein
MINPQCMCNQHLLGEHREIHTFIGTLRKGISIRGYLIGCLVDPHLIADRHDELIEEFKRRNWASGFDHKTPVDLEELEHLVKDLPRGNINIEANLQELSRRCYRCRALIRRYCLK